VRVTVIRDAALTAGQLAAVRSARLTTLLRRCGNELGVPPTATLAVRLTRDQELRELSRRFLGVDEATDVLAFPADEPRLPGAAHHIGDVAISVPRALAQAEDGAGEMRLLAVHGLLHCLGHDHGEPAPAAAMTALTRRLLPAQTVPDLLDAGRS
jgi:probable rRNA maturation factor